MKKLTATIILALVFAACTDPGGIDPPPFSSADESVAVTSGVAHSTAAFDPCPTFPWQLREGDNLPGTGVCRLPDNIAQPPDTVHSQIPTGQGIIWGVKGDTLAYAGSSTDDNIVSPDETITMTLKSGEWDWLEITEDDSARIAVEYTPPVAAQPSRLELPITIALVSGGRTYTLGRQTLVVEQENTDVLWTDVTLAAVPDTDTITQIVGYQKQIADGADFIGIVQIRFRGFKRDAHSLANAFNASGTWSGVTVYAIGRDYSSLVDGQRIVAQFNTAQQRLPAATPFSPGRVTATLLREVEGGFLLDALLELNGQNLRHDDHRTGDPAILRTNMRLAVNFVRAGTAQKRVFGPAGSEFTFELYRTVVNTDDSRIVSDEPWSCRANRPMSIYLWFTSGSDSHFVNQSLFRRVWFVNSGVTKGVVSENASEKRITFTLCP